MADQLVSCATCGNQFERGPSIGRPKVYCGADCRSKAQRLRLGIKPRWEDGIPACHKESTCYWCNEVFKPKQADRAKCCSRECGFNWLAAVRRLTTPVSYTTRMRVPAVTVKPTTRCCISCSEQFTPAPYARDLCQACRKPFLAERRKRLAVLTGTKAAARKARKLKLRGVKVEAVNPIKVLDRDNWTCQLCGVKTPRKLRGTYGDRAPEVDHILPLSQGGEHSYRNVQCACRKCNIAKSGTAKGQTLLFG